MEKTVQKLDKLGANHNNSEAQYLEHPGVMRQNRGTTASLRSLKIGEVFFMDMEFRHTLLATAARMRKDLLRIGWNYAIVEDKTNFRTGIKRIS